MAGILDALRGFFTPPPGLIEPTSFTLGRALTPEQFGMGVEDDYSNTASGETVGLTSAMRLVAVQAAVRLLTNDIASLPVDTFRGYGKDKAEISKPGWMVTPNPSNPNYTWQDYVKQVVFGMLTEGESFPRVFPNVRQPVGLGVIPARNVADIKADGLSVTYAMTGGRSLTPDELLHIPWLLPAGKLRGLNPIEAAREGIGIGLASDKFVGAYFGNGAVLSGYIKFPTGTDPDEKQINQMKADFKRKHVGAQKSHAVGALTGGAEFEPFPYNNRDAQLLELRDAVVEDVARLFGIPPHMLGSQKPGAVAYASVEQRSIDYVTHAVLPIVARFEAAHNRLLRGPETYMKFNMRGLLRGDEQARARYYKTLLDGKVVRRDEVRDWEDLPYDPEAAGYLETPNNNAPADVAAA